MSRQRWIQQPKGGLVAAVLMLTVLGPWGGSSALATEPAGGASALETSPGTWVEHQYRFHFMGFTSTYSCNGLIDKLKLLLRQSGARVQRIDPECGKGFDRPDRLAQVNIHFATLIPAASAPAASAAAMSAPGVWRHVVLAPQRPAPELLDGDCELVEQFGNALLPMFAVRDVHRALGCVPHQDLGPFSLSFDVFAPAEPQHGSAR